MSKTRDRSIESFDERVKETKLGYALFGLTNQDARGRSIPAIDNFNTIITILEREEIKKNELPYLQIKQIFK